MPESKNYPIGLKFSGIKTRELIKGMNEPELVSMVKNLDEKMKIKYSSFFKNPKIK